ncbi:MAG: hypothetical protein U0736_06960 [Gemmataceae bacterium]
MQHLRAWADAGHLFVARGDDRIVTHDGRKRKLSAIAADLAGALGRGHAAGDRGRGQQAWQHVAEAAALVLGRPGWSGWPTGRNSGSAGQRCRCG